MKGNLLVIILAAAILVAGGVAMAVNRGPANINVNGGSRGTVPFPHAQHQDRLKDCTVCHSTFPQETGAINTLKADGTLKPKQVMNTLCIKCHKQEKKAGKPHGPLTCSKCHVR